MSQLDQYLQQCDKAGMKPLPEILVALEKLQTGAPVEEGRITSSFEGEIAFFERVADYWKRSSAPDEQKSKEVERATQMQKIFRGIQTYAEDCLNSHQRVLEGVGALTKNGYKNVKDFGKRFLSPFLAMRLVHQIQPDYSSCSVQQILIHNKTEGLQKTLEADLFVKMDGFEDIQFFKKRFGTISTIIEAVSGIVRLVENTQSQNLMMPDSVFTLPDADFSAFCGKFGAAMADEEQKAADKVGEWLGRLSADSAYIFSVFSNVKGLLKRKKAKEVLKQSEARVQQVVASFVQRMGAEFGAFEAQMKTMEQLTVGEIETLVEKVKEARHLCESAAGAVRIMLPDCAAQLAQTEELARQIEAAEELLLSGLEPFVRRCFRDETGKIQQVMFFDEQSRRLIAALPFGPGQILRLLHLLQASGYEFARMKLAPDMKCLVNTIWAVTPHLNQMEYVADFYNALPSTIYDYQKPLLQKAILTFEDEIRKVCSQGAFNVAVGDIDKDQNFANRMQKMGEFIVAGCNAFKLRCDRLSDFQRKCTEKLEKLNDISVQARLQWSATIGEIRGEIQELCKMLPPELHGGIVQYWAGALCQVLSKKYMETLNNDLQKLKPLDGVNFDSNLEMGPSSAEVKQQLIEQLNDFCKLPLEQSFLISNKPNIRSLYEEMCDLGLQFMPDAVKNIDEIVMNVQTVYNFFQTECEIVLLANLHNDQICAERYPTIEACQKLMDESSGFMARNPPPEQQIAQKLSFLAEKSSVQHTYSVNPSNGAVILNLNNCIKALRNKPLALQDVAVSAASYICERASIRIIEQVSQFSKKMDSELLGITSSEQFSDIQRYFDDVKKNVEVDLKQDATNLKQFRGIIELRSQQRESTLKQMENALQSYNMIADKIANLTGILDSKKKDMYGQLQQRLIGPQGCVIVGSRAIQQFKGVLEEFTNYCKDQMVFKIQANDEKANSFFTNIYFKKGGVKLLAEQLLTIDQNLGNLDEEVKKIDKELQYLFNKSVKDMLDPKQVQNIAECREVAKISQVVSPLVKMVNDYEVKLEEIFLLEWSVAKVRFDLLDAVMVEAEGQLKLMPEVQKQAKSVTDPNYASFILEAVASVQSYITMIQKIFQQSVGLFKTLKAPALTKSHWCEIAEKTQLIQAIKFFSQGQLNLISQIPEIISACSLLFIITVNLFPTPAAIQSEQQSAEYKKFIHDTKDIVMRAENELSVRQAVEEINYWLQSEAKANFTLCELSNLSMEELNDVYSYKLIPVGAAWRPIFTALTEKKAVLLSVLTNPFAKFLKDQIEEAGNSIEAMTRLAQIMTTIQKQISVLEPVMGRKVLPNEHRKFYSALRAFAYAISQEYTDEAKDGIVNKQATISMQILPIISTKIPENFRVPFVGKQAVGVDNSSLGHFMETILAFESVSSQLGDVQLALRQYLEVKRLSFPRFYFLSDQDVLEILASANTNPTKALMPHVKKMFSAIEKLDINNYEDNTGFDIISFHSSEAEKVKLKCQIKVLLQTPPELWLNRLDLAIKETLKVETLQSVGLKSWNIRDVNKMNLDQHFDINLSFPTVKSNVSPFGLSEEFCNQVDFQAVSKTPDIQNLSGEVLTVVQAILFSSQIDAIIYGQGDQEQALKECYSKQKAYLKAYTDQLFQPQISTATFGTIEFVLQLKLRALATDTTHFLSIAEQLITQPQNRLWLWNKEIKTRLHRKSGDVYLIGLDTFLPYTYEYQGLYARLIHTPLTDRCYSTLVSALNCGKSSNPQGPAGTGKTETVKAFAAKIARPCIVFNCDSAIDRENLSRILVGIVLSGSMGCFDEVNRLSPAVLSAVSTDIENIQVAIQKRSTCLDLNQLEGQTLTLSDITVPISKVSPFSSVFVTMNPASREYRGRSELPYSLLRLLRGCFMGRADISLIMETILSTSGFVSAKQWAEKSELTYLLASRRIPKEVHLDWGLRSLQSVLRQAALTRAAICRKHKEALGDKENFLMEREVIIKALSDATFSRVQHRSADIFKEILGDVFGKIEAKEQMKFGAASENEAKLANNIATDNDRIGNLVLQFYRALTAKLGVALLGKTASGKSTIRQLLKTAINVSSLGMIEVKEFVIAPKSMSRQDLLGYVDPTTKEWNDGALTKAARAAVNLLQNRERPYLWPWIVFDGPIDPEWIEALNSSLDDNRLLSLSSGERVRFPMSLDPMDAFYSGISLKSNASGNQRMDFYIPTPVSFVFETDSVQHASPATVSRLAVILVADTNISEQQAIVGKIHQKLGESIQNFPDQLKQNLQEVTTHMILAGNGEKMLKYGPDPAADQKTDDKNKVAREEAFVSGAVRILACESENYLPDDQLKKIAQALGSGMIDLGKITASPKHVDSSSKQPFQQVWANRVIQSYLALNTSILISGAKQNGKFYTIQKAAEDMEIFQIVSLACTQLTAREDINRLLLAQCIEQQNSEGNKEIKPKSGKKLLIILRDIDCVLNDEYGHSQLFCLLWSIIAHNKIYFKQGNALHLKDIVFACTVTDVDQVPVRLRRLMGVINLKPMEQHDYELVLGSFNKYQSELNRQTNLGRWLQQAVNEAETTKLRSQSLNVSNIICLPNTIPFLREIDLSTFVQLSDKNYQGDKLATVFSYFLEYCVPYSSGRDAAKKDIQAAISKDYGSLIFTFAKDGSTASIVAKALQQDEPPKLKLTEEFINQKARLTILKEQLTHIKDLIPGLNFFKKVLDNSSDEQNSLFINTIAAFEYSFFYTGGCVSITQPNSFIVECAIMAGLTLGFDIKFTGCDLFTNQVLKFFCERVANGFTKILLLLDSVTIEQDKQWLAFISAIASRDVGYIRSKLGLADIRAIISIYSEKQGASDKTEEELTIQFMQLFVNSIIPCLILNPERSITDQIFIMAPPIRRTYNIVSFPIQPNNIVTNDQVNVMFKALMPTYSDTQKVDEKFHQLLQQYYKQYEIDGLVTYSNQYIRAFELYNIFKDHWVNDVKSQKERLANGLNQIASAQSEVDSLAKEAATSQQIVTNAKTAANEALVLITQKMEIVTQKKKEAGEMESYLVVEEQKISKEKDEAEAALSTVKPIIEEAKKAVSSIPMDAIAEVKSFSSPPQIVATVLEAVARFMGQTDCSWKGLRAFLAQQGITQKIATLDVQSVPMSAVNTVAKFVEDNKAQFDYETVKRASKAAAPLAKWVTANVQYLTIYVKIEPLMRKCKEASAKLDDLRVKLRDTKKLVTNLETEAEVLKNNFDKKTQEQMKYEAELKVIEDKMKRGQLLLDGLKDERARWAINEKEISKQLDSVEEAAVKSALMFVVAGNKTDDIRQSFAGQLRAIIDSLLYNAQFQDKVQKDGLRVSLQSLENASILNYLLQHRGFFAYAISYVTDSTGFMEFIRKSIKNAQFVSATSENLTNLVSIAARFGQTIIVTNCDQGHVSPALVPYLRYGTEGYKVSESATINSDDQSALDYNLITPDTTLMLPATSNKLAEVNSQFKLFIISSVKLSVESDLNSKLIELSFAPTEKSRTDLYMDQVLSIWSPETLTKIQQLRVKQAELRSQLYEIENSLLDALKQSASSKVNILQDQNLMDVLKKANIQQQEINKAQDLAKKVEQELEVLKQKAISIAEIVGKCVVALEAIAKLNDLYIIDDNTVIPLLCEILVNLRSKQTQQVRISDEMVQLSTKQFINVIYRRLSNMVFTPDKVGALALLMKQCCNNVFSQELFDFFTGTVQADSKSFSWAGKSEPQIKLLSTALSKNQTVDLGNAQKWGQFIQKAETAKEFTIQIVPEHCQSCNPAEKAAIIVAARPDLLSQALSYACEEVLAIKGEKIEDPIMQAMNVAQGMQQPIIIYTAAGQDPTNNLNGQILALAPGREAEADEKFIEIIDGMGRKYEQNNKSRHCIVIKGAHLCQQWLSVLPSKLNELSASFNQKYDKNFSDSLRILLLLEPKLGFPQGLSRIAWRICLQQSISPRDTMCGIIREWPDVSKSKSVLKPVFYALMYVISALHTTLESRRVFAPRGVANDPGWNAMDPITIGEIFMKILNFNITQPMIFVERVRGLCTDAIYGVSTKDNCDLLLCQKLVELAFHKDLVTNILEFASGKAAQPVSDLQSNFSNIQSADFGRLCVQFPTLKYFIPPVDCLTMPDNQIKEGFINYVQKVFSSKPSADQLALPANALLTKGEKDSLLTKSILQRASSYTVASSGGDQDLYSPILKLKKQFDQMEGQFNEVVKAVAVPKTSKTTPIVEEISSQIETLKKLMKIIKKDLNEAKFASENFLLASSIVKATARLVSSAIIPEPWAAGFLSPPTSMAPVMNPELTTLSPGNPEVYLNLILESLNALIKGLKACEAGDRGGVIELDLAKYPRPPAILEAVRRYEGVCQGVELNNVALEARLGSGATRSYATVQISANNFVMNGAGYAKGLDFAAPQGALPVISITAATKQTGVQVPIYLDRQREVRMPVVENVVVEANQANTEASVSLFGIYVSLTGR